MTLNEMEIVKIPGDIMPDLSGESWIWGKFDGTSLAGGKGSDKDLQNHHHHHHQDHHQDHHQHHHQHQYQHHRYQIGRDVIHRARGGPTDLHCTIG